MQYYRSSFEGVCSTVSEMQYYSSKGACSICQTRCVSLWTAQPCQHGACRKCLTSLNSFTACLACEDKVEFFWCPGYQAGCQFQARQDTWKQHEINCKGAYVACPYQCDSVILKKALRQHIDSECRLRLATCRHCKDSLFHDQLERHETFCPEALVGCSFCHQGNIKRGTLPDHAKSCGKTPKPCPLKEQGCSFVGADTDMDEHLNLKKHATYFQEVKRHLEARETEIAGLRHQLGTIMNEIRESSANHVVLFDRQLEWSVFVPNISIYTSGTTRPHPQMSPIYKRRSTKTTFCFTLQYERNKSYTYDAVLWQHLILRKGSSETSEKFTVQVTEHGYVTARKAGITFKTQDVLSYLMNRDTFYVVRVTMHE